MYKGIMIQVSLHHTATSSSSSQELSFTAAIDFITIRVHPLSYHCRTCKARLRDHEPGETPSHVRSLPPDCPVMTANEPEN